MDNALTWLLFPARDGGHAATMSSMNLRAVRSTAMLASVGALALLVTGCAAAGPGPAPTSTAPTSATNVAEEIIGVWGDEVTAGQPHLEFTEDGTVNGSDGCNGIGSTYAVQDDRIDIAQFVSTLKACEGVDDWLRGIRAVELDGDMLVVFDVSGERIGELERAE